MNGVKPIPAELLTDSAVLLTPTGSGYLRDNLDSVRIVRVSAITDYTTGAHARLHRACNVLRLCELLAFGYGIRGGSVVGILRRDLRGSFRGAFRRRGSHHWRVKARKTGGEHI